MSILRVVSDIVFDRAFTAAQSPITSDWRGAEDLNGCQFFCTYTGTATVNLTVECSAMTPTQNRQNPYASWSKVYTVKNGVAAAEGFIDPPDPPMDRPFGAYRVIATTDANITDFKVVVCRHGLG